jgi:hypothetical protein
MGTRYIKVVDERYIVPEKKGGGLIKFEVWEKDGEVVKYSMAYINPRIFPNDHGRVVGYDNAHNFHHKHYLGEIFEIDDFTSYKELTERFRKDLQEFIDDGN